MSETDDLVGTLTITAGPDGPSYSWGGSIEALNWAASLHPVPQPAANVDATIRVFSYGDLEVDGLDLYFCESDHLSEVDEVGHLVAYTEAVGHQLPKDYRRLLGVFTFDVLGDQMGGYWEGSEAGLVMVSEAVEALIADIHSLIPDNANFQSGHLIGHYKPATHSVALEAKCMSILQACVQFLLVTNQ